MNCVLSSALLTQDDSCHPPVLRARQHSHDINPDFYFSSFVQAHPLPSFIPLSSASRPSRRPHVLPLLHPRLSLHPNLLSSQFYPSHSFGFISLIHRPSPCSAAQTPVRRISPTPLPRFLSLLTLCVCLSAGVDVRWSDGGHPLLQGRTHLQEVRPLQGPRWDQPGKGNSSRRVPLRFMAKHNAADQSRIFCILQQSDTGVQCQDCAVTSPVSHRSRNTTMNYMILEVNRNQ